jgi:hypothetical protein
MLRFYAMEQGLHFVLLASSRKPHSVDLALDLCCTQGDDIRIRGMSDTQNETASSKTDP